MKLVIVSAPWGNYLRFNDATSTIGTFTWEPRGWAVSPKGDRWTRTLLTVRYSMALRGWKNRLGLKNPGIRWYRDLCYRNKASASDKIVSIYGWTPDEWNYLLGMTQTLKPLAVELNCSCPNIAKTPLTSEIFRLATSYHDLRVIAKIPPVFFEPIVEMAWEAGIRIFHACNTLPSPYGGISGKPLIKISQAVVESLRTKYPTMIIVGGGGITSVSDAIEYKKCGANHVAVGSMLFNPLNWRKIGPIHDLMTTGQTINFGDQNDVTVG